MLWMFGVFYKTMCNKPPCFFIGWFWWKIGGVR